MPEIDPAPAITTRWRVSGNSARFRIPLTTYTLWLKEIQQFYPNVNGRFQVLGLLLRPHDHRGKGTATCADDPPMLTGIQRPSKSVTAYAPTRPFGSDMLAVYDQQDTPN